MNILRLFILLFVMLMIGAPRQAQSQTKSDPFVEAARKREAATKVVDLTFKMREISPKGTPVPGAGWALGGAKEGSVLDTDLVLESTNRLVFQGSMVRFEGNHPVWHVASAKALPTEVLSVSKNGSAKTFYPNGRATENSPSGTMGPDSRNYQLKITYLFPLLVAYRGTDRSIAIYAASSFKASGVTQPIRGKDCREYAQMVGNDARLSYFVDPELDYNVVRRVLVRNRRIVNQIDIGYEKSSVCEWVPISWVEHAYTASGNLERRREVEVVSTKFNEPLSEDQFDVVFPPGAVVTDQGDAQDTKRYRVQADGGFRLLSVDGRELSTVVWHGNLPWYRRYVWWFVGGGAAMVLLVVALLRRKRRVVPN
jgi:hypothetical protein